MPRPQPPAGFVTIGPGIYISLISVTGLSLQAIADSAPNVILIFGWMGALTRHLQKYSQNYAELYPHATQIIVKCGPSVIWTSERARQKRLTAVVEALETLGCLDTTGKTIGESIRTRPRILVHSFSNGGGIQLTSLGRLLSSKYASTPSLELVSAIILDSAPCAGTFHTIGMALRIAIRNPVARYIALVAIYFTHAIRLSLQMAFGTETMATQYLKMLLRPRLFPWLNPQAPRLYVFSKNDKLVPWQEVEQHAETARASGLNVRCEVYEESAHVAHMLLDRKRYWTSVQALWQAAHHESHERTTKATT